MVTECLLTVTSYSMLIKMYLGLKQYLCFRYHDRPCFFFCCCCFFFFFVPTLQFLYPSKNKKIFIPTDPNMFKKNWTNNLKNARIAKIMLKIIFFNFLDVLNSIICMFSGTVDGI